MTDLFGGLEPARGHHVQIVDADYSSVDPTAFTVNTKDAKSIRLGVDVQSITGSGCTVTVTVSGVDDASSVLYTLLSKAITTSGVTELVIDPEIPASTGNPAVAQLPLPHRVSVACVGSGTRTTLQYSVAVDVEAFD